MDISVVIPAKDEAESLPELTAWIEKVMKANNFTYEVIVIDDGSKDNTWQVLEELSNSNPNIKGIKFCRNYGKSAALNVAFDAIQGQVVITMDADLQDSPDEIPDLRRMIVEEGYDLVSGWKAKRYDPLSKTIPTKLFNYATRSMSGIHNLHDFNCGLKAYDAKVVKSIEVYGEMHRYIPVIAKWAGFTKIGEKVVEHRARKYGTSKFGFDRFINGFLDLMTITFMSKFGKRPMHLFGLIGTLCFMAGFVIAAILTFQKFVYDIQHMTDRPIFYFGLLAMILGSQLFLAGFLAEMLARNNPERNNYQVEKRI